MTYSDYAIFDNQVVLSGGAKANIESEKAVDIVRFMLKTNGFSVLDETVLKLVGASNNEFKMNLYVENLSTGEKTAIKIQHQGTGGTAKDKVFRHVIEMQAVGHPCILVLSGSQFVNSRSACNIVTWAKSQVCGSLKGVFTLNELQQWMRFNKV